MSKCIWEKYLNKVLQVFYHLNDNELKLAAKLYNKKVILFSESQKPQVFNLEGKEQVAIEHTGSHRFGHYSRLELIG